MVRDVTDEEIGLKVLHEPKISTQDAVPKLSVDILAIHGIGAHPDDTWCKRVGEDDGEAKYVNWLQDAHMLPRVVPKTRIMRYGYESRWFGEDTISLKASTVAQRLLRALNRARKDDPLRPLVFIAHCFGGLVILKAVVDAQRSDEKWPGIYKSTTGMLFLGTPFRGAGGFNQIEMLQAIQSQYDEDQIQGSNLNILAPGNESLMDLMDLFFETRQGKNIARVACFFEQKPSNVGKIYKGPRIEKFVVDETSGCLDQSEATEKFSLSRNHFNMNKFGKPEEEDFETVCEVIDSMVQQAPALITARDQGFYDYQVPFRLTGLPVSGNFVDRDLEMDQIERSLKPIGRERRKIHVLHGLGGIGKTQLAIAYARRFRKRYSAVLWLNGNSHDTLLQSFSSFATHARINPRPSSLTETTSNDQKTLEEARTAVLQWLTREGNCQWLMIFDNVDRDYQAEIQDLQSYDVESFFPDADHGSILITTRLSRLGQLGTQLGLTTVSNEQASRIFLAHSGLPSDTPDLERLLKKLTGLPLALVQAGRYIRETGTTCDRFLGLYQTSLSELQADIPQLREYPNHSIQTTWSISYEAIKKSNPAAAKLLQLWAYLDHQDLWFELLNRGLINFEFGNQIPDWFQQISQSETSFLRVMKSLLDYSLVNSHENTQSYSIHPLVHDWCLEFIGRDQIDMAQLALTVVGLAVPKRDEPEYWVQDRRMLPHANRCIHYMPVSESHGAKDYGRALHGLSRLYRDQSKIDIAIMLCQSALSEKEKAYGLEHLSTLSTVHMLGKLYNRQRNFSEAENMLQRALIGEENELGPEHIETLNIMNSLGSLYLEQGKIAEAETLYQRSLQGFEKELGSNDNDVFMVAHNLGRVLVKQGRIDKAEKMYQQALIGREKNLGSSHISTLRIVSDLALLYDRQGRFTEAEEMHKRAVKGMENALGSEHIDTLLEFFKLGIFYGNQGRTNEAEVLLQRTLSRMEKVLGIEHHETLEIVYSLGLVYEKQGKGAEAQEMLQRYLAGKEKVYGPEHTTTLEAVNALGKFYHNQGKLAEAEKLYQQALSGYLKHEGSDHPGMIRVRRNLDLLAKNSRRDNRSNFWSILLRGKS